ncbi:hypothetical protein ICN41_04200 [Polynucleobacter sp. 15G-AUS-farblos]|uniref:hypothetical protein n=1 Tax=Polynucleobacter sp. 15G-AUS-farblos TaxID=2689094 RepID=UPI001C0BAE18|nr:hypothetical protein [Polynucleobacter sp. 15G-AUS-farblos]MBU3583190.1 hypothetical protein [Polynucleobacter sp. 15G-AUS-farblos]
MMQWMQTFALVELSITCAVVIVWLVQTMMSKPLAMPIKWFSVLLLTNPFFWPIGLSLELPLVAYVRGVTGDLSVVLTLLLWSSVLLPSRPVPLAFRIALSIIAILFYPLALGLGMLDPYVWGYGSLGLLIAITTFALVCGLLGWTKGVWIIAIAIVAWAGHWHESTNLWDYVLDPLLCLWALISCIHVVYRKRRDKARSGYLFRPG